jgi:hypothetical protein
MGYQTNDVSTPFIYAASMGQQVGPGVWGREPAGMPAMEGEP